MTLTTQLGCSCGQVRIEADQAPIISAECHCNSCRAAGAKLLALPGTRSFMEANGGTRFVLYRKDRVRFLKGAELLQEFCLAPTSKTRRVFTTCCNTPVFLEFEKGHWLSLYGCLWADGTLPPLDLRTMTSDLVDPSMLGGDIPNAKQQSVKFFAKLLRAWIAMGFRTPRIDVGRRETYV